MSGWPRVKLGQVLHLDLNPVPVDAITLYPMVGILSFGRGLFDREPIENGKTSYRQFYRLKADHIVMSQLFGWEGALALSTEKFAGKFLSPQFPTFLCDENQLDRNYLGWVMRRPALWEDLGSRASGMGDRRRTLNPEALFACEIPLPPLLEQRRIVARIEALADKTEEARSLRRQTIEQGEALVNSAGRTVLAGIDEPVTELGQWLDKTREGIQTGPFGAQLGSHEFQDSGVPVLTIGNVQYDGLDMSGLQYVSEEKARYLERYAISSGDILFARMGTVGRCCIVPEKAQGWLINYHIIRVALNQACVDPRFIHWTIRCSKDIDTYLAEKIRGATRQGVNS